MLSVWLAAQPLTILGIVQGIDGPLPGAHIQCGTSDRATYSDIDGRFILDSLPSTTTISVSYIGYSRYDTLIQGGPGDSVFLSVVLLKDYLGLSDVVVTASRIQVPRYEALLPVFRLTPDLLERAQAVSMAEGLSFSPGLRVENNCANCGFTQVRMNGLAGPYTQVLINSRPVFSALMGVYGLEMIPAAMIDRVEVVRGGGSSLYGGSAIAGIINIITRQPSTTGGGVRLETQLLPDGSADNIGNGYTTFTSRDARHSTAVYANLRQRNPWDANGDGLSEITQLRQGSLGWDYSYKPTEAQMLRWNGYLLHEFRRGGSHFDRLPHQSAVAEQLTHRILGTQLSLEGQSASNKFRYAMYGALQLISRDSYYGAGGRLLGPSDTLTEADKLALNAYGESSDISAQAGMQFTFLPADKWLILSGMEWQYNTVQDRMPGYGRYINQQVSLGGSYLQTEWSPQNNLTIHAGLRGDLLVLDGLYGLSVDTFQQQSILPVLMPRIGIRYKAGNRWMVRLNYAEGYRGPQAFDEDLHIETVGGAARFVQRAPNLQPEQSSSFTASLQYTITDKKIQQSLLLEGFATRLTAPFLLADAEELPNGISVITKTNGEGATVAGVTAEWSAAGSNWQWQSGLTLQRAHYDTEEVLWIPGSNNQDSVVSISSFLRTPNLYGYWSASVDILPFLTLQGSGTYTGSMRVARVQQIDNEFPEILTTKGFWDLNVSLQCRLAKGEKGTWIATTGVRNLLNAFQPDVPVGVDRDASYIYGPMRPRSVVFGIRFDY